jgi:flagellar motor switch protein FliN/FliY
MADELSISKSEMDALMGDVQAEQAPPVSAALKNKLQMVFEASNKASATTLESILNKKVDITLKEVAGRNSQQLSKELPQNIIFTEVEMAGDVDGSTYLVLPKESGAVIADIMMGGEGTSPPDELSDLYIGALSETFQQILNAGNVNIAENTGKNIEILSPKVSVVDLKSKDLPIAEKNLLMIKSKLNIEGLVKDGDMVQLFPINTAQALAGEGIAPSPGKPMPSGVHPVQFGALKSAQVQQLPTNIKLLMDVPLQVTVELGRTQMQIRNVLELGAGSIIELEKAAGEPVDILVNGKLVAKGTVVVIDENFGVRITDIISPQQIQESIMS